MIYLLYFIFGLAPSIIWLLYFLKKDVHPESSRMIILVFLLGMAVVPLAAILECIPIGLGGEGKFQCFLPDSFKVLFPSLWGVILYAFLGIALIEEAAKYLVVRLKVLRDPELDEPLDVMLYMIIAALGFAAIENILILFSPGKPLLIQEASFIIAFRFIGATFLHALCSGVIGYFMARSFFAPKFKAALLSIGFAMAIVLHGLFNLSIMKIEESLTVKAGAMSIANPQAFYFSLFTLITILSGLAIFVTLGFRNLKKLASICKTEINS